MLLPLIPMIFLMVYLEYKKARFLKNLNGNNIQFINFNRKKFFIKTLLIQIEVWIFIIYRYFFHLPIIYNVTLEYRTMYSSATVSLFVVIVILTTNTIRDFYIADKCIIHPFGPKKFLTKQSTIKTQKQINKDAWKVVIDKVETEFSTKLKDTKLIVENKNVQQLNFFFSKAKPAPCR